MSQHYLYVNPSTATPRYLGLKPSVNFLVLCLRSNDKFRYTLSKKKFSEKVFNQEIRKKNYQLKLPFWIKEVFVHSIQE